MRNMEIRIHNQGGSVEAFFQDNPALVARILKRIQSISVFTTDIIAIAGDYSLTTFVASRVNRVDFVTKDFVPWKHPDDILDVVELAMIEEPNRLERELRETLVPEFTGILPRLEGQPEFQYACLQEAVRLPQRKQHFSRCNIFNQTRGEILSGPNFAPHRKKCKNTSTIYSSMRCGIRQTLARNVIKGLWLAKNKAKMKNQVQEINEPALEAQVLRSTQPVLHGRDQSSKQSNARHEQGLFS
jgi:hypothetical protein